MPPGRSRCCAPAAARPSRRRRGRPSPRRRPRPPRRPPASPSPTPSPLVGEPSAPTGPQILVPRPPSPSPGTITPPPLPTASPKPDTSPGPVIITPQSAPPSSSPLPATLATAGPILPSPSASPAASPAPGDILDPNSYAILGDKLSGVNKPGQVFDLDGHVNIFYQDGVLGGDHAHYDGQRYIDVTGNTFVKNRSGDTTLFADSVRFDTTTQKATLVRGRGESTQGVEQGKLHFSGSTMTTDRSGVTHVERANITTCENPRGGYHIESKTLDVYPGNKAVARSNVLYLGALAILYLPIVVISLARDEFGSRRQPGFLPIVGYSQSEGFYVKARIGFSPSDYYYGYYRIEEYTKIGLGLGYVATLRRKDGRRQTDINFFRMKNKVDGSNSNNLTLNDDEAFSRSTRAKFGLNYTGNYGPLVSLPPQFDLTAALDHGNERGDHQNYSFHRTSTGSQGSSNNYGVTDHRAFSQKLSNDVTLSYTTSENVGYPASTTLHYETLTHFSGRSYDYDLTFDRYDTSAPSYAQTRAGARDPPARPAVPALARVPDHRAVHAGPVQRSAGAAQPRQARAHDAARRGALSARAGARARAGQRSLRASHRAAGRVRHGRPQGADRSAGDAHDEPVRARDQHDLVQRVARERAVRRTVQVDRRAGQRFETGQRRAAHLQRRRVLGLAHRDHVLQPPGAGGGLSDHVAPVTALDAAARRQLHARARASASTAPACSSRRRSAT